MKIILTGGGTGGHFYPLIAVAEEINRIIDDENIADADIYYVSDSPYDKKSLYENRIIYKEVTSGKMRLSFSPKSIIDLIKLAVGIIQGFFVVFSIFPDVIFSKGGYASVPTVFAARLLGIPVIIHESDSVPGRANIWAGKFARAVAVSYKQDASYFPKDKVIHTGQPIRRDLLDTVDEGAYEFLELTRDVPVLLILGGSLGSQKINYVLEEILAELVKKYQIIHQVGKKHFDEMKKLTDASLINSEYKNRYNIFDSLNTLSMKMAGGIADVVVTRAGSTLFEIAHWELPSIVIPIPKSHGNHQISNAYNYAREDACVVIEENNLSDQLLMFEIDRIYNNPDIQEAMKEGARKFSLPGAATKIAEEIIGIALAHDA